MLFGHPREQAFEPRLGGVDLLVQPSRVVARGGELAAQVVILGAQPLAQRDELRHFFFERVELRFHGGNIEQISSRVKV